ncbi:MAG: hypothetical protein EOO28_21555 [Comamonadaceae bacterium]|nr:MAG: hypothetical protein EOO28_21555 [Comamonadaceae bacterium]
MEHGVVTGNYIDQCALLAERAADGWKTFELTGKISSRSDFIASISAVIPLDPPLPLTSHKWAALSDSMLGGLDLIDADKVLVFWPNSDQLRAKDPESYCGIIETFEFVSKIAHDDKFGNGKLTKLLVLLS